MSNAPTPEYQGSTLQPVILRAPLDAPRRRIDVLAIVPAVVTGACVWHKCGTFQPVVLEDQRSCKFESMESVIENELDRLRFRGTIVLEWPLPIQTVHWRQYAKTAADATEAIAYRRGLAFKRLSRYKVAEAFGYRNAGMKTIVGAMRVAGLGNKERGVQDRAALAAAFALVAGIRHGWQR